MATFIDSDELLDNIHASINNAEQYMLHETNLAPVAHALWICKSVDDNDNGEYTCSRCGCGEEHSISCEVSYCWRCGAKMDGVIYNE